MTGLELKLKRVGADVKAKDLAVELGMTSSGISRVESRRLVTDEVAARYLAALSTWLTKSTNVEGAA